MVDVNNFGVGDGCENVTQKGTPKIKRNYLNSLTLSNVGELSWN